MFIRWTFALKDAYLTLQTAVYDSMTYVVNELKIKIHDVFRDILTVIVCNDCWNGSL